MGDANAMAVVVHMGEIHMYDLITEIQIFLD